MFVGVLSLIVRLSCAKTSCNCRWTFDGFVDARTEAVLRRLQQQAPCLSDAEREALSELKDIKVLLSSYTSKINTV